MNARWNQTFEWDADKASRNLRKHGISFEEALTAFADSLSMTVPDPDSEAEERFLLLGLSLRARLLVVVHAERSDNIRIISARPATRQERRRYEEER